MRAAMVIVRCLVCGYARESITHRNGFWGRPEHLFVDPRWWMRLVNRMFRPAKGG